MTVIVISSLNRQNYLTPIDFESFCCFSFPYLVPLFLDFAFSAKQFPGGYHHCYLTPIDFESFKESGGIEYTADVIWGLQLSVMSNELFGREGKIKEKRDMVRKAKLASPRNIDLVCLKTLLLSVLETHWPMVFSPFLEFASAHEPAKMHQAEKALMNATKRPQEPHRVLIPPEPVQGPYRQLSAYLTQQRGIPPALVQILVDDGILYQEKEHNNMVFINPSRTFAELRGSNSFKPFHTALPVSLLEKSVKPA